MENIEIKAKVSGLGDFLELEAVMGPEYNDREKETEKVNRLLNILDIKRKDLVSKSYRELVGY